MDGNKKSQFIEIVMKYFFLICALIAILSVFIITVFIFIKGGPAIFKIGPINFLFGSKWAPSGELYGILPMILASIYATLGAIVIGVPIGIFTAVFLSEIAPEFLTKIIRPAVDLLAGIPSVVYGFFGLLVFVPIINDKFDNGGNSLLAAMIILGIMILPTIVSISESSIKAVPTEYKEGSLALGASHIQTIFKVILPAAKSGIFTAVILGIGRAIGETMAVILVIGNTPLIPTALTDRARTLTANIALEMGYAQGLQREALFATGVILFLFIMLLNLILTFAKKRAGE
ncbi:MAG: phosphate ABC transporter permease subunit PstC [Clostridiaceae bacterium]